MFSELKTDELYEILRLRSRIFVVEQRCAYEDPDGKDYDSLHIFMRDDASSRVIACLRAFPLDSGTVQVGRVATLEHGKGYGNRILDIGLREITERMHPHRILIEAQCQAQGFYEKKGFTVCSEPFLEDGIPHVKMEMLLNNRHGY